MICLEALDSLLLVGGVIMLFIGFVGVLVENYKLRKRLQDPPRT